MNIEPQNKLTLEWTRMEDGGMALVFDAKTWKVYKDIANSRDKTAEHMILTAVVECIGPILMDNYTLNRFTGR